MKASEPTQSSIPQIIIELAAAVELRVHAAIACRDACSLPRAQMRPFIKELDEASKAEHAAMQKMAKHLRGDP